MFFSILLIDPELLLNKALPADCHSSSRTSPIHVQAVAFDLILCPTVNRAGYNAKVVTLDICASLKKASLIKFKGYLSGAAAKMNVDRHAL